MMRRLLPVLLCLVLAGMEHAHGDDETDRPIIAQLLATPQAYSDKAVTIYGLVIDTYEDGAEFLLQDVSQMPLRVVAPPGSRVDVGDELLVRGAFRDRAPAAVLEARLVVPTKVLGGGGCC